MHLLLVALMFLNALFLEYQLSHKQHWTFELYVFVQGFAVVLYLICAVILPSELGRYATYRAYYYSRRRWILLLLFSLMDFADTPVIGRAHLASLDWPYLAVVVRRSALLLAAMKTRNSSSTHSWQSCSSAS